MNKCAACEAPELANVPHADTCCRHPRRLQFRWPAEIVEPDDPPGPWDRLWQWWQSRGWNGDPRDLL
jgi:hypothetical protein